MYIMGKKANKTKKSKEENEGCGCLAWTLIIVVGFLVVSVGYGVALHFEEQSLPTQEQLYGRWELTQHTRSHRGPRTTSRISYRPVYESWGAGGFLQLNPDGTFIEQNFRTQNFIATGTWKVDRVPYMSIVLTLDVEDKGDFPFISERMMNGYNNGVLRLLSRANNVQYFNDDLVRS